MVHLLSFKLSRDIKLITAQKNRLFVCPDQQNVFPGSILFYFHLHRVKTYHCDCPDEDEGIHILTGRRKVPMNIKISKAQHGVENISFCTEDIIPGRTLRTHKHLHNDEIIFINNGEGLFTLDEKAIEVKSGAVIFVPRGVWHGLVNTGKENIRMVFQYSPAGSEEYFIENGTRVGTPFIERTAEEFATAEKKYGMVYKQPFSEK